MKLLAGTDAGLPSRQPGTTLITELGYMVAAGLSPYEALRTATVNAGDFARRYARGMPRVGVVEVGSAADLILLPADPRADLKALSRVRGVMVAGRWLNEKGPRINTVVADRSDQSHLTERSVPSDTLERLLSGAFMR